MKKTFIILASVCVLGLAAMSADAAGPVVKATYLTTGHPAVKVLPVGYPHHGGYHRHPGYHRGWYGPRPCMAPVVVPAPRYVPAPVYPVYRYPRPYYYPRSGFYYSTPGFSVGVGF